MSERQPPEQWCYCPDPEGPCDENGGHKHPRSVWSIRAEQAIEKALGEVQDNIDAMPTLSLAIACLQAEAGELDRDDIESLEASYAEPACVCPPDLLERGGYRGNCPVHSLAPPSSLLKDS